MFFIGILLLTSTTSGQVVALIAAALIGIPANVWNGGRTRTKNTRVPRAFPPASVDTSAPFPLRNGVAQWGEVQMLGCCFTSHANCQWA